jgi:tRNA threonylcarbamoyladenosine biosynthesis protein TsaE
MKAILENKFEVMRVETQSEKETHDVAKRFASKLRGGDVVSISGDIGAGKTYFVKGIAAALGIEEDEVNSPTFDLVHEFKGASITLVHIDFYRINEPSADDIEWAKEYINSNNLCVIEWGERVVRLLVERYYSVDIGFSKEPNARIITISKNSPSSQ